jgi:hypothetical protein
MVTLIKWCSLQKSVSKKFYEIDALFIVLISQVDKSEVGIHITSDDYNYKVTKHSSLLGPSCKLQIGPIRKSVQLH